MTSQRWEQTVRQQVSLGGLLPLGGPRDGAWIAEKAAVSVLRDVVRPERDVRLGRVRIRLADPNGPYDEPAVPAPAGALPPGELRIEADFAVLTEEGPGGSEPLPARADRLRAVLARAAAERLGLVVTEVDLRVTGLLEGARSGGEAGGGDAAGEGTGEGAAADTTAGTASPAAPAAPSGPTTDEARVAAAVLAVPRVTGLAGLSGGLGRAVMLSGVRGAADGASVPRRHLRVSVSVSAQGEGRVLDTALAVRAAAAEALHDRPTVAVLVTRIA